MSLAARIILLAAAAGLLPACEATDDHECPYEAATGSDGDGFDGPTLIYPNSHPLDWLTTDAAGLQREDDTLTLINAHRASIGVAPLRMVRTLRRVARGQSRHMRADVHNYFEHVNPEGDTPGRRLSYNGVCWHNTAENIASGTLTAAAVVQGWLNSPSHRAHIEDPGYTRTGIGWQPGPPGDYDDYWTQVFAD